MGGTFFVLVWVCGCCGKEVVSRTALSGCENKNFSMLCLQSVPICVVNDVCVRSNYFDDAMFDKYLKPFPSILWSIIK